MPPVHMKGDGRKAKNPKKTLLRLLSYLKPYRVTLVLDGGKLVAQGTHETLLQTSQIYREVYESQVKGGEESCLQ